jgi:hypothetical protein
MQEGQVGKAVKALNSDGIADITNQVVQEMQRKHPPDNPPTLPDSPAPTPLQFTAAETLKALLSFPRGTAAGPSNLRVEHLLNAVSCPSPTIGDSTLQSLTSVINVLMCGNVPPSIAPFLSGANLFPLKKKNGGLRPIAVGEVLRRWTSKCAAQSATKDCLSFLLPSQLGVGMSNACEAVIHAVSAILSDSSTLSTAKNTLLVDLINAFNNVDRTHLLQTVRQYAPGLSAWVELSYGHQAVLRLGKHTLLSCRGVQQGDPLGPLLFSLCLQPLLIRIQEDVPGLQLHAWYLDDGTFVGTQDQLSRVVDLLESEGPSLGFVLSKEKSVIWNPDHPDGAPSSIRGITVSAHDGVELLGSPIGSEAFCKASLAKKLEKIGILLQNLSLLEDTQMEMFALRSCLSFCKLSYILRTCRSSIITAETASFDEMVKSTLSSILGTPVNEATWKQSVLPISLGGLGLRSTFQHAPAAYISSMISSRNILNSITAGRDFPPSELLDIELSMLSEATGCTRSLQDLTVSGCSQKGLSSEIDKLSLISLTAMLHSTRDKARLLSLQLPYAGEWLRALPSPNLGLHLSPPEFRLACLFRLGLAIFSQDGPCLQCGQASDSFGDHAVGCSGNSDRIFRHDRLRDALFSVAQAAALAPRREVVSMIPSSQSRPADIFLPAWNDGRPTAVDVTVVSPTQAALIHQAASTPGAALLHAEQRKIQKHDAACHAVGVAFLPLAFETFGGFSEQTSLFVRSLARMQAQRAGLSPSTAVSHLCQRLSILLQKGNSNIFLCRFCPPSAAVDGVL